MAEESTQQRQERLQASNNAGRQRLNEMWQAFSERAPEALDHAMQRQQELKRMLAGISVTNVLYGPAADNIQFPTQAGNHSRSLT